MSGERPHLNETYAKSKDPFVQTLVRAMNMCWVHDPQKRPTARQVEKFLDSALVSLGVTAAGTTKDKR